MGPFSGKHILLGITGSIAAYKACQLIRDLHYLGAEVRVILTESAKQFITPLTLETLTGNEVVQTMFPENRMVKTRHISWAEWADCLVVCPATLNMIGKVRAGIADDFLSTAIAASRTPVIFAPAMDYEMANNSIFQSNCDTLKNMGYRFVDSEEGELASGATGKGRLASLDRIVDAIKMAVLSNDRLKGRRVLVTAGPTREWLDPVRFFSNGSSGKMGYALAEEAVLRGAEVTLISGPSNCRPFAHVNYMSVESAKEMAEVVLGLWPDYDVLVKAAAVSDYRPESREEQKIKKSDNRLALNLIRNPDILKEAAAVKGGRLVVGFSMETENGEANALAKCREKNCDLICLNYIRENSGFGSRTNEVTLIEKNGHSTQLPALEKREVAERIFDKIEELMKQKR